MPLLNNSRPTISITQDTRAAMKDRVIEAVLGFQGDVPSGTTATYTTVMSILTNNRITRIRLPPVPLTIMIGTRNKTEIITISSNNPIFEDEELSGMGPMETGAFDSSMK